MADEGTGPGEGYPGGYGGPAGSGLPAPRYPTSPAPWWGEPWPNGPVAPGAAVYGGVPPMQNGWGAPPVINDVIPGGPGHRAPSPIPRMSIILGVVLLALVCSGIGAAVGVHVGEDHGKTTKVTQSSPVTSPAIVASGGSTSIEAVAAAVQPAVVSIVEKTSALEGTGSGVVINAADGYILTNNHVVSAVAAGEGSLTVTTYDGRSVAGKVVGRDPSADIAVVKVSLTGLTQARMGNSLSLKVGETVVAFGSPLGLQGTVTSGIVSALDRPVTTVDPNDPSASSGTQATIDAIQTDAAINPGNSGGPLVDTAGAVIGINSAIASLSDDESQGGQSTESGSIGVGFAIPINEALYTADQIIATGHAVHAIIGLALAASSADTTSGATVQSVTAGGPAAKAGIRAGDVITEVDAKMVPDADAVIVAIRANHEPGQTVTVTFLRSGTTHTVKVILEASAPS